MPLSPAVEYFLSAYETSTRSITQQLIGLSDTIQNALHSENNSIFAIRSPAVDVGGNGVIVNAAGFTLFLQTATEKPVYKGILQTIDQGINTILNNWRYTHQWFTDQINANGWQDQAEELGSVADFAAYTTEYLNNWKDSVDVPDGVNAAVLSAIGAQLDLLKMICIMNRVTESLRAGIEHRYDSIDNGAYAAMRHAAGDISTGGLERLIDKDQQIINHAVLQAGKQINPDSFDENFTRAATTVEINTDTLQGWTDKIQTLEENGLSWLSETEWNEYKSFVDLLSEQYDSLPEGGIEKLNTDFRELEENAVTVTAATMQAIDGHYREMFNLLRNMGVPIPQTVYDFWTVANIPNNTLIVSYFFQALSVTRHIVENLIQTHDLIGAGGTTIQLDYNQFLEYMTQLFVGSETK